MARETEKKSILAKVKTAGDWSLLLILSVALLTLWGMKTASAIEKGSDSGREIPRFVSLRSDEVNVRTGPGLRYPIEWVYQRAELPVEVLAEFEAWRKVRDLDGNEGWVHRQLLSAKRTVVILDKQRLIRSKANARARPVARLEAGVIASLDKCKPDWCKISVAGYEGWIEAAYIWGVYPPEYSE